MQRCVRRDREGQKEEESDYLTWRGGEGRGGEKREYEGELVKVNGPASQQVEGPKSPDPAVGEGLEAIPAMEKKMERLQLLTLGHIKMRSTIGMVMWMR